MPESNVPTATCIALLVVVVIVGATTVAVSPSELFAVVTATSYIVDAFGVENAIANIDHLPEAPSVKL